MIPVCEILLFHADLTLPNRTKTVSTVSCRKRGERSYLRSSSRTYTLSIQILATRGEMRTLRSSSLSISLSRFEICQPLSLIVQHTTVLARGRPHTCRLDFPINSARDDQFLLGTRQYRNYSKTRNFFPASRITSSLRKLVEEFRENAGKLL